MEIRKPADRRRLRERLSEGTQQARQGEATLAIPVLTAALARVRSDKAEAQQRFQAMCDAATGNQTAMPAVNPVIASKAVTYRVWSALILAAEAALATYVAALTLSGGLLLHLVAGTVATLMLCGLAKLLVASRVSARRMQDSARRLERQLFRAVIGASALLALFFVARFFQGAEVVFSLVSTGLSFAVAYIVGLCHTLSTLLSAPADEVKRYTELSLLEGELAGLLSLAEETAASAKERPPCGEACRLGLGTVMGLALLLLLPVRAGAQRLDVWVDVSGSLANAEFERVRDVLADPLPLLTLIGAQAIALTPFWDEQSALSGATAWHLPARPSARPCEADSVFTATRKAREAACDAAQAKARKRWEAEVERALAPYREALAAIDVTGDKAQTCLYPLLDRVTASDGLHLVITDGAHGNCGPPPPPPPRHSAHAMGAAHATGAAHAVGAIPAVVILVPDNGGTGLAERMRRREEALRCLYPGLAVLPSWRLDGRFMALVPILAAGRE